MLINRLIIFGPPPDARSPTNSGVLHKYPNPNADHVVSMDVLDQSFDAETGLLRLERVIGVKQGAPGWAVRVSFQAHRRNALETFVRLQRTDFDSSLDLRSPLDARWV